MNSYARMENILRWLDEHATSQPTLAEMAAVAGLGESHFHHEFVRWTGVTPKDFVQCLTLADAKERLLRGEAVLETSTEVGLSGPGRLHDLCVSLEAATPGEIKSGGAGLTIRWGIAESPFGPCLLAETTRGICRLSFLEEEINDDEVVADWPRAEWIRDDPHTAHRLGSLFQTSPEPSTLRAWVRGSAFQMRVWRALLEIPNGALSTYGRLATAIGSPGAARAVGTAVGSNPVAFLIPCHRVIRETGAISGYRWGVGRKRALLAWEGARGVRNEW
jgi:AraC family transcriptional regulator of adaptative response/methylated-DNA-[protein]-cysteine methyltransferase